MEAQKNQVETISAIRNDFKQDTQLQKARVQDISTTQEVMQQDMDRQLQQFKEDMRHKTLKDQAYQNRHNVVIIGLQEHDVHSVYSVAMKFF